MLHALQVFTTVVVGVMVGVEFCVAVFVNAIMNALPGDNGQLGRSHGARLLGAVMPFWYFTSPRSASPQSGPSSPGASLAPPSSAPQAGC